MSIFLRDLISVSIVLGIMIFVHEWGHFIAAKFFGVRVDVFSFGFGPRLFGVKRGDTDYRLSAFPLAATCAWRATMSSKSALAPITNISPNRAGSAS